jgi:hypothetical protein
MRIIPKNWPADLSLPPPIPKHWFEGHKWISEHVGELREKYPDQWVAVFHGEVIAGGKNAGEVLRLAQEKTGERDIAMDLVETERKSYSPGRVLRDRS